MVAGLESGDDSLVHPELTGEGGLGQAVLYPVLDHDDCELIRDGGSCQFGRNLRSFLVLNQS